MKNIKTEEEPCQITTTSSSPPKSVSYASQPRTLSPYYVYSRIESQYPVPTSTSHAAPDHHPLLTVAAAAAAIEERSCQAANPTPPEVPPIYHHEVPEFVCAGYEIPIAMESECSSLLDLPGNAARRRVEAALEVVEEERRKSMLTPPSSNPVSPAPSPDPLDLAIPVRELMSHLPPRKRCKMILESMESERSLMVTQRQNSVIQFAKAS